jgi:hypothetical protein
MRRLLLPLAAAAALLMPSPASAIVNGSPTAQGAYPAQVFVGANTNGTGGIDRYCSGTLVGSRQVLTAARCATYGLNNSQNLPLSGFDVRVGNVRLEDATHVDVAARDVHSAYDGETGANDVAMLTLAGPIDAEPTRVVDAGETALWAPGTTARVLGWGENEDHGFVSDALQQGDVKILPDAGCTPTDRLCAAGETQNPCAQDSGSPLLVPDGGVFALAGVFSGTSCSTAGTPGRYTRVGENKLNRWVHDRTPEANFDFSHQPRAGEPVTLTSTSRHPEGAGYFTTFRWDLDNDGAFDDATGRSVSAVFPRRGQGRGRPRGLQARRRQVVDLLQRRRRAAPGRTTTTVVPTVAPPAKTGPLATILAAKRPKVRRGHFAIRVRFARTAPKGTAVIEVYRGGRRIGIARTKVKRGATKRVRGEADAQRPPSAEPLVNPPPEGPSCACGSAARSCARSA